MAEDLPDKNIFMMCRSLNRSALRGLPAGYTVRSCREDELAIWKAMPFDDPAEAEMHAAYMDDFFEATYRRDVALFFRKTLFVCDAADNPVGTCLLWKSYGAFNAIHWLKVRKEYEGLGIGRALMSEILRDLEEEAFPIYLHTQPESFRAIKLYSDFGFELLEDPQIGNRKNHLEESLPFLEEVMPAHDFQRLKTCLAPASFLALLKDEVKHEF